MMKKQNSEITCPYKSANVNRSPQQLQSFSTTPIRQIVKHGLVVTARAVVGWAGSARCPGLATLLSYKSVVLTSRPLAGGWEKRKYPHWGYSEYRTRPLYLM